MSPKAKRKAPAIVRFTPAKIKEFRHKADSSLVWFEKFLWRDVDLDPDFHFPLLWKLEEVPLRQLVCEFRGSLKSSRVRAAMAWIGLKEINWAWLLVMNRFENAKAFLEKTRGKFEWGPTAGLLQEVYGDRLQNFRDWTSERIVFQRTDPNASPFMSIAGIETALESGHYSGIICEDLEGADEDKALIPSRESRNFVFNRAPPLLQKPERQPIWVVGTPHGDHSLVWAVRELADEQERKFPGNPLNWRYHWNEVLDESGNSRWSARFSNHYLETLQVAAQMDPSARRLWDQQMMLRERSTSEGAFDMDAVHKATYELRHGRLMVYPSLDLDPKDAAKTGLPIGDVPRMKTVDLAYCRPYCHIDALHKDPDQRKIKAQSMWAILIVYVSPDMHAFLVDWWVKDASFDEAVHAFFKLYRKHIPQKITIDPVGAQIWLKSYIRLAERTIYKRMLSLPVLWRSQPTILPRPSYRTIEAEKQNQEKESYILQQLEGLFNLSWIHLPAKAEIVLEHLSNVGTGSGFVDAADALAQGPSLWDAPISPERTKALKMRQRAVELISRVSPLTGYRRPWDALSNTIHNI